MRRSSAAPLTVALALCYAAPVHAQALSGRLVELFTFGSQTTPLAVSTWSDPTNPNAGAMPDLGFSAATVQPNGAVLGFLTRWVSAEPGNIPISASSGGVTFNFVGGSPVRGTVSPGPIVAEGAPTLGRGRVVVGVNYDNLRFNTLRGVPLKNLRLLFTHENGTGDTCATEPGGDCAALGTPVDENDLLEVSLSLDMRMSVASLFVTYGLLENLDLGVLVPVTHAGLDASSVARLVPFGTLPSGAPRHFLAGSADDPVLTSTQVVRGSATGLGDVAARLKLGLVRTPRLAVALVGDARFATGDEADFLGAGHTSVRTQGALSARFGDFSPHLNLGYLWRSGDGINDAILATAGFDQVVAPWATLAAGLVSEFQVGTGVMQLPGSVTFTEPVVRTVRPLDVPDTRDNPLAASFGVKLTTWSNLTATTNVLIPVSRTGPRPDLAWGFGLHYDF